MGPNKISAIGSFQFNTGSVEDSSHCNKRRSTEFSNLLSLKGSYQNILVVVVVITIIIIVHGIYTFCQ
jgi:hypothetical protein